MVGREGEVFSNRVLHYASSLRGTQQYWFRQRCRLISMVDTLGLPFSSLTVQLIYNGLNWLISSAQKIPTLQQVESKL